MAAIANVKVIESMIEIDGTNYRKVNRPVREGDIVKANEDTVDITVGKFYAVDSVDGERFTFIDDDGDYRTRRVNDEEYEVYEKVTEGRTEAKPKSDELFAYEGVQYRKVKRKAEVGEKILIVNPWISGGAYSCGDVLTVNKLWRDDCVECNEARSYNNGDGMIAGHEYVVLEPVAPESPYKPGDKVRSNYNGRIHTIKERRPSADYSGYGTAWTLTNGNWLGENQFELYEEESKPVRLIIGESVRLLTGGGQRCLHGFRNGDICEVLSEIDADGDVKLRNGVVIGYAKPSQLEVVKPKPSAPARVPVGSFVKVTEKDRSYCSIAPGSVGKVVEDDNRRVPYKVEALDGSSFGWYKADELTVLSEAEAKAAVEAEAERVKWAAIGRKVNEYKAGDVVEVVKTGKPSHFSAHNEGDIGIVVLGDGTERPFVAVRGERQYSYVKLLVPVEQRFGRTEAAVN